jgi:L-ascorbate metabolism protein UlaG (beta-lactamase superfamily)
MNTFTLTWLGQGGYALNIAGQTLYFDPYMSDMVGKKEGLQRLVPPPIEPAEARPDVYLATHDHMDHLDTDFIRQIDCAGVRFICPESCKTALLALECGIEESQITVVNRGDVLDLDGFSLRAIYVDHTPDSVGFVITVQGLTVYFTGDTLYGEAVGEGVNAGIICCCVNGKWGNMNAEEAVQVALRSGAKLAIPNHYGMFAANTVDPAGFCAMAEAAGLRTYTMQHNETIDLTKEAPHA